MRPYLFGLLLLILSGSQSLIAQCPPASAAGIHVVQQGETLFSISQRYGLKVNQLRNLNALKAGDAIYPCDELVVFLSGPQAFSTVAAPATYSNQPSVITPSTMTPRAVPSPTAVPPAARQSGRLHVVRAGETMAQLARTYGYTEERFREFNGYSAFQEPLAGTTVRSEHCSCTAASPTTAQQPAPTTYGGSPVIANEVTNSFSRKSPGGGTPLSTVIPAGTTNSPVANRFVADDRSYLQPAESAMIDEINLMRSNPAGYIPFVEAFVRNFSARFGRQIDRRYVNSLISDLSNTPALSRLVAHPCLYRTARDHGNYLRSVNQFSHTGAGGSTPQARVQQSCSDLQGATSLKPNGFLVGNENLVGGYTTPREAVIGLLIDEGLQDPGHRQTLLAPEWRYVGISNFGTVGQFTNNYVQLFGR